MNNSCNLSLYFYLNLITNLKLDRALKIIQKHLKNPKHLKFFNKKNNKIL